MDAFETVVSEILWRDGYWVQNSLKVDLTKEEELAIGRPSTPRWELDIVAYSGRRNELLVVECKSYLDSFGVQFRAFDGTDEILAKRFKLFNDETLHIQAIGRDAEGRLQYRYHPEWEHVRSTGKERRLLRFGSALPRVRRAVKAALAGSIPMQVR